MIVSYYEDQAILKLMIFLLQLLKCRDHRHKLPCLVSQLCIYLKNILCFFFLCVCVSGYTHVSKNICIFIHMRISAHGVQESALEPQELKLEVAVGCQMQVLGTDLWVLCKSSYIVLNIEPPAAFLIISCKTINKELAVLWNYWLEMGYKRNWNDLLMEGDTH